MSLRIGIDIGSTTVKVVVLDEQNKLLFRSYERHYSKTRERACAVSYTHLPLFSTACSPQRSGPGCWGWETTRRPLPSSGP